MTKKIKMEVPEWAEWSAKPTIEEKVHSVVDELPKGFMFYPALIHKKVIKDKKFEKMLMRRTHESLQKLQERGFLFHDKKNRKYFASINGNKVKLYKVV